MQKGFKPELLSDINLINNRLTKKTLSLKLITYSLKPTTIYEKTNQSDTHPDR